MDGGLIIIAMRLIVSVVEAFRWWICVEAKVDDSICPCSRARPVPGGDRLFTLHSPFSLLVLVIAWVILNPGLQ